MNHNLILLHPTFDCGVKTHHTSIHHSISSYSSSIASAILKRKMTYHMMNFQFHKFCSTTSIFWLWSQDPHNFIFILTSYFIPHSTYLIFHNKTICSINKIMILQVFKFAKTYFIIIASSLGTSFFAFST